MSEAEIQKRLDTYMPFYNPLVKNKKYPMQENKLI